MALKFVRPDTVTLPLTDGETITIRARLNAGERRAMYGRMYRPGTIDVDPMRVYLAQLTAYLLDWTAKDDAGRKVDIADLPIADLESTINALDPESFAEVVAALDRYTDAADAVRSEEKNVPVGGIAS